VTEVILARQAGNLDWSYVMSQTKPLVELKEAPQILVELGKRRIEFER